MTAAIVVRDLRRTYLSKSGLLGNKRVERPIRIARELFEEEP